MNNFSVYTTWEFNDGKLQAPRRLSRALYPASTTRPSTLEDKIERRREELAWRRERGDLVAGVQLACDVADKIDTAEELTKVEEGILTHCVTTELLMWIGCHLEELGLVAA
jgi:hypothetical protein